MKSTLEELDIVIKDFVKANQEYLHNNVENMTELPEVLALMQLHGWTMEEYQQAVHDNLSPEEQEVEQLVRQLAALGITDEDFQHIFETQGAEAVHDILYPVTDVKR